MKVLAVYGSGRKEGNSSTLLRRAVQGARDAGHQVLEYEVYDMRFGGCTGCRKCKEGGEKVCVLQDDLRPYFEELYQADAVLVSAPNHTGQPCGPMITYLNRHYCLLDTDWNVKVKPGIKVAGFFSQGQLDEACYQQTYRGFMADYQRRNMELIDILVHSGPTPAGERPDLMQRAYELGKGL
ncbi:MAG: flavodoxin family protein [Eubacteriales bacterium]|nr:flavodoxin family protein [Eubacteriales bacterium]